MNIERTLKICSNCMEETEVGETDEGIGLTYFGDHASFHSDTYIVSVCCGEPILLVDPNHYQTLYVFWEHYKEIPDEVMKELNIKVMEKHDE